MENNYDTIDNTMNTFWHRNRIILKTVLIGILMLLLLIPTLFIQGLINERKDRQREAVSEISSKWAGPQTITGPVIGIPYTEMVTEQHNTHTVKKWAYFLPAKLDIHARIVPEKRYRGIYQVIVYTTELQISGSYDNLHLEELHLSPGDMLWNEAAMFFDIKDVQGLKEDMTLHFAGVDLDMVPARFATDQFKTALSAALPASVGASLTASQAGSSLSAASHGSLEFSAMVKLKGSGNLQFIPVGKDTRVRTESSWADPSFTGSYLPDLRSVKDSGFVADWKVLYLNRKYPQQWKDGSYDLDASAFGVNLIIPVDSYQQTTRSVKYAILIILLTFTAFLLIEWIYTRTIHSLQYVLVGFALCLFYTLLLSFSEYIGFNPAYGVAAAATIALIAWYVKSILQSGKMAGFVGGLLVVQYGFIFILIQLQDYALLLGSIGLFMTLAVVMYFSRKIKWN
jgi:inner membrane protein